MSRFFAVKEPVSSPTPTKIGIGGGKGGVVLGILKKKKKNSPYGVLLGFEPPALLESLKTAFGADIPATWAMVVVAYQNLIPILGAAADLARAHPEKNVPKSLDDILAVMIEALGEKTG